MKLAAICSVLCLTAFASAQFTDTETHTYGTFQDPLAVPSVTTMDFNQYSGPGLVTKVIVNSTVQINAEPLCLQNECGSDVDAVVFHGRHFTLYTEENVLQDRSFSFEYAMPDGVLDFDDQLLDGQYRCWNVGDSITSYGGVPTDEWIGTGVVPVTLSQGQDIWSVLPFCADLSHGDPFLFATVTRTIYIEFGMADLLGLLSAWEQESSEYDLDGDGSVGFSDVLVMLLNWETNTPAPVAPLESKMDQEATVVK